MDAHIDFRKSKEIECLCGDTLKTQDVPNSNTSFQSKYLEPPIKVVEEGETDAKVTALCPITPNLCEHNSDAIFVITSPLSLESPHSSNGDTMDSSSNHSTGASDSPRTPQDGIFDPFAPGPADLLFAPICKKFLKVPRRIVSRQLNFDESDDLPDDADDVETLSEMMLLDTVYGAVLEVIVAKQAEDFLAENKNHLLELPSPLTPTSSPRFTEIAETCPGAPVKAAASKSRKIDPGLCKRLDF